jgi:hypothetical protein
MMDVVDVSPGSLTPMYLTLRSSHFVDRVVVFFFFAGVRFGVLH